MSARRRNQGKWHKNTFSATDRSGASAVSWWISAMPRRIASCGVARQMASSPIRMVPAARWGVSGGVFFFFGFSPPPFSPPPPPLIAHPHGAGVRLVVAGDDFHHGRLARAVFAHQGMHLTGLDGKVHTPQRMDAAKSLMNAVQGHERRPAARRRSYRSRRYSSERSQADSPDGLLRGSSGA